MAKPRRRPGLALHQFTLAGLVVIGIWVGGSVTASMLAAQAAPQATPDRPTGVGTPTAPPNQVLIGIAFFLTVFVMAPTFTKVKDEAVDPLRANKITQEVAMKRAEKPMREFMFDQTRTKDIALFAKMAKLEKPKTRADIPTYVLIPAFTISELKTAFQIGFLIFLPFLIIDLVVATTLMSMGMMMLPPVFIALPFKILLFVLVDGWDLVTRSLVESFHV